MCHDSVYLLFHMLAFKKKKKIHISPRSSLNIFLTKKDFDFLLANALRSTYNTNCTLKKRKYICNFLDFLPSFLLFLLWEFLGAKKKTASVARNISINEDPSLPTTTPHEPVLLLSRKPNYAQMHGWASSCLLRRVISNAEFSYRVKTRKGRGRGKELDK